MAKTIDLYSLQKIAERTLESIGITGKRVTIRWDGTDQDYTDSQTFIHLSKTFCGVDLTRRTKRNLALLTGIIQHEVIHWLQDDKAEETARLSVGLPFFWVNIICDIQGEKQIKCILPVKTLKPLHMTRSMIKRAKFKQYQADSNANPTFPEEASAVALMGRFRKYSEGYHDLRKLTGHCMRSKELSLWLWKSTPVDPEHNPQFIIDTANKFPELCQQDPGQPSDGKVTPVTKSSSGLVGDQLEQARAAAKARMRIYYMRKPAQPALPGALELAAKLQMRLTRTPSTMTIKAVGEINRRDLATDQDMPFDYTVDIEESIGRSVILCVDISASMLGEDNARLAKPRAQIKPLPRGQDAVIMVDDDPLYADDNMSKALKVAQAMTIAVRNENGNVVGVLFGDYALMSSGDDKASILFPKHAREMVAPGTSFTWLKWIWQKFPAFQVIVITDGDGDVPSHITAEERQRTVLIKLEPGTPETDVIADTVIQLDSIKDLPRHILNAIN